MLPRAACCPTPPSQSLPPISTKGVRTRAFVEIAVSFTNLKCQLNSLAHSFFRRLSPTKETSYPESSSCEEPPQKDCLPTTASFCKESKLYFPFSFLHLKFFVVIFLNSGYRSPVFPSIFPSSPWHESMEATWSPISKCSILANLQKEVGNAQNYRVSHATEQLLVTQTSWDPFLFAIATYRSKWSSNSQQVYLLYLPARQTCSFMLKLMAHVADHFHIFLLFNIYYFHSLQR